MSVLSGKNIILGVTAGIAAYKSAFLTRLLIKKGANVQVVMTPSSKEFVTPLHFQRFRKTKYILHLPTKMMIMLNGITT